MNEDIGWIQRFQNYRSALKNLNDAVDLSKTRQLSNLEKQGLIQSFEFTHELAWNLIKDYFQFQGNMEIMSSRDAAREAFHKGLISKGDIWMEMIRSRNLSSHTYNQVIADDISNLICRDYIVEFNNLEKKMQALEKSE